MGRREEVEQLVEELESVDLRQFWWGSPLLERASRLRSPSVVRSMLLRHHFLQNKEADSCHVIRQAIRCNDGNELPTLWQIIDEVGEAGEMNGQLRDQYSMLWASAFVLGEIGGKPAFGAVVDRLDDADADQQYLLSRVAMHLVFRYSQVQSPEEAEVEYHDLKTGEVDRHRMNDIDPEHYQHVLFRRK